MKTHARWMWSQLLLHAAFWRTIFFTMAFPHTHKYLIENISSDLLSVEMITTAVSTITINSLYVKYSDSIFKHFKLYCTIECTIYAIVLPLVGCGIITPSCYFLTDVIAGAIICHMISCCSNRLRKLIYDRESREQYDNSQPIASALSAIIGGVLGMLPIPLWLAWSFIAVGVVIDDVFYWIAYNKATR